MAPLTAVATAAVRDAEDGPEFCEEVLRETGLRLWVIDGEEEARLSAQGVLLGWPGATGTGLRHRRLVDGTGRRWTMAGSEPRVTSPLGPLRLQAIKAARRPARPISAKRSPR